ncbi:MAG: Crp/Fnr family transcriptional regulator [Actinomycetota bacterium]|nr:Crp/Fnr family transcriptional regulator [Actinomycetota bacterium]
MRGHADLAARTQPADWVRYGDRKSLAEDIGGFAEFADANRDELDILAARASYVNLTDREVLYQPGDRSGHVYLLVDGHYKVEYPQAGRLWLVGHASGHHVVGWRDVVRQSRRIARVTAIGSSRFVAIPTEAFEAFLDGCPPAVLRLIRMNSPWLRESLARAVDLGTVDVRRRLARYLISLPAMRGYLQIPLTQVEVATCLGASRQSVSEAFTEFQRRGWIEPDGRSGWHLLNLPALERFADRNPSSVHASRPCLVNSSVRPSVHALRTAGPYRSCRRQRFGASPRPHTWST